MIFAVIDTNILVSALLASDPQTSNPYKIIVAALSGIITPVLSPDILDEYQDVLLRSKFGFDPGKVQIIIEELINCGLVVKPVISGTKVVDADDQCFYDAYDFCQDYPIYLVTGNRRHFPLNGNIVSAAEMCGILQSNQN